MFKVMFFLYRRSDLTPEQFVDYSKQTHVPLVAQVPGLARYVVNHTIANPFGAPGTCDAVAELWFESMAGFQEAVTTDEGKTALADQANYLDMTRTHALFMDETTVIHELAG